MGKIFWRKIGTSCLSALVSRFYTCLRLENPYLATFYKPLNSYHHSLNGLDPQIIFLSCSVPLCHIMGLPASQGKNKGGGGKIRKKRRRKEREGGGERGWVGDMKERRKERREEKEKGSREGKGKVEDRKIFKKSVKEVLCLRQLSHTERLKSNRRHTQHLCHLIFGLLPSPLDSPKHLDPKKVVITPLKTHPVRVTTSSFTEHVIGHISNFCPRTYLDFSEILQSQRIQMETCCLPDKTHIYSIHSKYRLFAPDHHVSTSS